jgi:hypothetical protein
MADIKALLFLLRRNAEAIKDGTSPVRYQPDCGVHLKVFRDVLGRTVKARTNVTAAGGVSGEIWIGVAGK